MASKKIKEILERKNKNENPVEAYYKNIIEKDSLNYYKNIIQRGAKEGQSLYAHIENMVGVIVKIVDILKLPNIEIKVLLTAISIHDINKVPDYSKYKAYLDITSEQNDKGEFINLIKECERLKIEDFFQNYREYLHDIKIIIDGHSAHLNQNGEILFCDTDTKLDRDTIKKLINLIRGADCIDLSKDFTEEIKKNQFLEHINKVSIEMGKTYKFISHKFSDSRGDLSNMINSITMEFMKSKGSIPLLLYPEGCCYLVDEKYEEESYSKKELVEYITNKVKESILDDLDNFITNKQAGIVVDEKAFEIGNIEEIIWNISNRADKFKLLDDKSVDKKNKVINLNFDEARKNFKEIDSDELNRIIIFEREKINKLSKELENADKKEAKNLKKDLKSVEKELIEKEEIKKGLLGYKKLTEFVKSEKYSFNRDEDINRLSEFIRAMYSFINSYVSGKNTKIAWEKLYDILKLEFDEICYLNLVKKDPLYHRPYLIGELLFERYKDEKKEDLINLFIEYFEGKDIGSLSKEDEMWLDLQKYIASNLVFSFEKVNIGIYKKSLDNYINEENGKCTICGSAFIGTDWMAIDVPKKLVMVQQFSNRIKAGGYEPRRKVCNICRTEYLLKKAVYSTKSEVSRRYISIYPKGFYTQEKLKFLRESFNDFNKREINSLLFDGYTSFNEVEGNYVSTPKFSGGKVYGIDIPNSEKLVSNITTLPMNFDGKAKESRIYIDSLMEAVYFNKYFDMKIGVTEQPYMTNGFANDKDIYIPSVPIMYSNLFGEDFTKKQVEQIFNLFVELFKIAKKMGLSTDFVYDMLQALNDGKNSFIYELYKLIKKLEASNKKKNIDSTIRGIKPFVDKILKYVEEEKDLTSLEKLAIYANDKKIYTRSGKFIKDNGITKPLDIAIEEFLKSDTEVIKMEDVRPLAIYEVQKHFKRVNLGRLSNEKAKDIEIFVNTVFEEIFENSCKMSKRKLDENKRKITSVYTYYFRANYKKDREEV